MKKLSPFIRYDLPIIGRMLLPVFFIMVIAIHYNEFILNAILANKAINTGIIVTAMCGVVLILMRLIYMQHDMSALDRFIRETQSGTEMKKLLDAPWLRRRAIWHYLEHLAHTEGTLVSQLDQDALQNELVALSEEYNSKMEMPQFLVGFMIAMGLLGTFIGLLETLTGISGMLDGMGHGGDIEKEFTKLVGELRKPLAGMGIAFSASMFGLVTSLMLSVMMTMLRRYMSRVMEKARSVMHRLLTRIKTNLPPEGTSLVVAGGGGGGAGAHVDMSFMGPRADEQGESRSGAVVEDESLSDKVSDAYFRSQDAIATMANSVNLLSKRMDSIAKTLEQNIEVTQKTNALLNFGPRMVEANNELILELKGISMGQGDGQKLMQKIVGSLIQIDQSLMANNTKDLLSTQREATGTLGEIFSIEQTHTRLVSEMIEALREGNREVLQAVRGLSERIAKQDEITAESGRNLTEINENFSRVVSSFSMLDSVAENIGRQTVLVEASLTEGRSTQKALIQGIQKELRDFTDTLRTAMNR